MPKQYEAMRDKFKKSGESDKAAKTKAAKIYNSTHEDSVVSGEKENVVKKKKKEVKKTNPFFTA